VGFERYKEREESLGVGADMVDNEEKKERKPRFDCL
jgi:hypothetical protein